MFVASVYFFNLGLSEAERPQLLTRSFDREMLVKNISLFNFHIYDGVLQSKQSAQRALADSNSLTEIENYVTANAKDTNKNLFGAAKGRNVILVSLESTQSFVINEKVNGKEITPFLNDFIKESYNFSNVYHQTGQGKPLILNLSLTIHFIRLDEALCSLQMRAINTWPPRRYSKITDIIQRCSMLIIKAFGIAT